MSRNPIRTKMGKRRKRILFLYLSLLLMVLLLLCAGRFLPVSEAPKQADVIIILSGGGGRVEQGVKLFQKGYAPQLLLSNAKEGPALPVTCAKRPSPWASRNLPFLPRTLPRAPTRTRSSRSRSCSRRDSSRRLWCRRIFICGG